MENADGSDEIVAIREALKRADYGAARDGLTALEANGTTERVTTLRMRTELEAGDVAAARRAYDAFGAAHPRRAIVQPVVAHLLLAEGKLDAAESMLHAVQERKPDAPASLRLRDRLRAARQRETALELAQKLADPQTGAEVRETAARELAAMTPTDDWADDPVAATIAFFAHAPDPVSALANYDAALIELSCDYGYLKWPKRIQPLIRGRSVLDVGCGFGGYGMGYLTAGATRYVGLDPVMDLDSTFARNKRAQRDGDMGITPREIAARLPAIELFQGKSEDLSLSEKFDAISLHNVTEHLIELDRVFAGLAKLCHAETRVVFLHHNFYCWNGHHSWDWSTRLRFVDDLDLDNPDHQAIYDWRHIDRAPELPSDHYVHTNLNRVRLAEIEATTRDHFEIETWEPNPSKPKTRARLTPEILDRVRRTIPDIEAHELLTNTVFCIARARR